MAYKFCKTKEINLLDNLYNDLDNYNRLSKEISIQLVRLKEFYKHIVIEISSISNFADTSELFDQLELLQSAISTIIYKYDYKCDDELYDLVKDLDRLDDIDERKYWFEQFKKC
jgi:hypothetical protein